MGGCRPFGTIAFRNEDVLLERHCLPVVSFPDRRPPIGSVVNLRYLPEAPEQAFIVSFLHMWAAPVGLLALGLGALLGWMKG